MSSVHERPETKPFFWESVSMLPSSSDNRAVRSHQSERVFDGGHQEFMQALQCLFLEFWDLETRSLESLVPAPQPAADGPDRQQLLQQLSTGGWCVQLPQVTLPQPIMSLTLARRHHLIVWECPQVLHEKLDICHPQLWREYSEPGLVTPHAGKLEWRMPDFSCDTCSSLMLLLSQSIWLAFLQGHSFCFQLRFRSD